MTENFRKFLMEEYANKVAKSESMDFTIGYYKNKIKDLKWYNNDRDLMQKHKRFLNYIYSTFEKYIIHRNIIIFYYEKIPCSISVLKNTIDISRTGLTRVINDSTEEGWLSSKVNPKNKRQILILPTKIRINFWLLYCKRKYEKSRQAGLADAHKALYHYDKNIETFLKKKK